MLAAAPATAVSASIRPAKVTSSQTQLPALVSATPVSWTPNTFAGSSQCNTQWFGAGCAPSTVYATAVVNDEVVVAGAFTEACEPGPASDGYCEPGSTVTRDDIFAYQLGTGTIDPDFVPQLNQGPVNALVAGPNDTVYVGGDFTSVNGVSAEGLVQLSVTPGEPSDGQVVSAFTGQVTGVVNALAYDGSNGLYVGGLFSAADGTTSNGLVRMNATTGAVDSAFSFTLGDQVVGTTLQVGTLALSPDGDQLAVGGSFQQMNGQSRPRVALISTGGGFGDTATLDDWSAPVLTNDCSKEHDYVNGLDFSPNGVDFDVATTGFKSAGGASICDAVARFSAQATGNDVQPIWTNYTGGDTFHSVADTGSIIYVGGHDRWINNECGDNSSCEENVVLVNGLTAIDANTGLALPWWQPGTLRGVGVQSLTPIAPGAFSGLPDGGLVLGTDVSTIGGSYHSQNALFPLYTTTAQTPGGPIPSGMYANGRIGGEDETDTGKPAQCVDDTNDSSSSGNKVQIWTCLDDDSQNWTVESNGTIQINGLCLDTNDGDTGNGTKIVIATCTGATSEEWSQGSGNTLVNQASGTCLDDPNASTTNGEQLQIWSCNGNIQQVWPLPVAQAPPPPPPTGPMYSQLLQANTDVPCVDDTGDSSASGNPVQVWMCLEDPSQEWTVESNGTIQINGLCLDTSDGGTTAGTAVVVNTCDGSSTQVWTWASGSSHTLVNKGANECLNDPSSDTANGTKLQIWTCSSTTSEQWRLPTV
jgi:hypothetical protein